MLITEMEMKSSDSVCLGGLVLERSTLNTSGHPRDDVVQVVGVFHRPISRLKAIDTVLCEGTELKAFLENNS